MSKDMQIMLQSILNQIALVKTAEDAYKLIAKMAKAGGDDIQTYDEVRKELGLEK